MTFTAHTSSPHILIVDDDDGIRELIIQFFEEQGFVVNGASHAQEARDLLKFFVFDAITLDVMMPGEDGLSLLNYIKSSLKTPVILLSARGEVSDRILGFETGADDYLPKPFDPTELLLRLKALLRRTQNPDKTLINLGIFTFETKKGELKKGEEEIPLNAIEVTLLRAFTKHLGEVLSREALIEMCNLSVNPRSVDVQILRLRKKLQTDAYSPLKTVRNVGYTLWPN